jgi:hypothetical protein
MNAACTSGPIVNPTYTDFAIMRTACVIRLPLTRRAECLGQEEGKVDASDGVPSNGGFSRTF